MTTIQKNKKVYNEWKMTMVTTKGKLLSILHALEDYKEKSPVAYDIYTELFYAVRKAEEELPHEI